MNIVTRPLFRQIRNVKWSRQLSSNVVKVDDFTIKSSLPYKGPTYERLFDRLWANSALFKEKVALVSVENNKSYTYSQLFRCMAVFATSLLKKLGLQSNDIVAIALPNCPQFPVVAFGAIQAGCIITPINPMYKSYELIHQLKLTQPKIVVTIAQTHDTIQKALKDAEVHAKIIIVDDPNSSVPDGVIRYTELAESSEPDYSLLDKVEKLPEDVAFLPFSSGTTGLPKGVEITYRNLLGSLDIMLHEKFCLASLANDNYQEVFTCVLPFFHIYGLVILLMGHLSMGCKLITMATFKPDVYLNTLKNEKNTLLYAVPPLLTLLGKTPTVTTEYFEHLKFIFCGAAPLSGTDVKEFIGKLNPKTKFIQGYGMTETTSMGIMTTKSDGNTHFGSCGNPVIGFELRFADPDTGSLVPIGQPGEVLLKTPCLMSGYYKNEQATKASMTSDGFYKTGDLGVYNFEGGFYIQDRLKELIKVKGMQVAPAELESILRSHPSVIDAGVIGKPDEYQGEVPKAFVVLNKAKPVTDEELKDFVAGKVSSYKKIHEVTFIDAIPKNAAGKVLRRELRDM